MTINSLSHKKGRLFRRAALTTISILMVSALYAGMRSDIATVFKSLSAAAEFSGPALEDYLRENNQAALKKDLAGIASKFSLDGIELYSANGSIIASGTSHGVLPPSCVMLGESFCAGWPFLLVARHSQRIGQGGEPAFLVLYSTITARVAAALFPAVLLLLLSYQLLRGRGFLCKAACVHNDDHERVVHFRSRIDELEKQRNQALSSSRAKDEFLAHMSHEIRTSMNGITGVLSLLQNSDLSPEKSRLLDAALQSADSLLLITNDVLDFAKIESGKISFENIAFDLRKLIEECIALQIDTAASKDIGLHSFLPLDIATRVIGDPTRLGQIIANLLSNGVKFTNEGEVNFRVQLQEGDQYSQLLCFTVEDTGIGIEAGKLETLFDMFTQADPDTTRKFGGTGLGLNVCKKLVELQGGEIGAVSRPGFGACFWFTLRLETAREAALEQPGLPPVQKKIALFDSCRTCCMIITEYLRECQVSAEPCSGAEKILDSLRSRKSKGYVPDILMIDYHGLASDIESVIQGTADIYGKRSPRLFLLAPRNEGIEGLAKMEIAGIIYKPLYLQELYLELGEEEKRKESTAVKRTDMLQGNVLLVDDEQINLHVGRKILENIGFDVDTAADGGEALEKTAKKRYNLIFMDVQMPKMGGMEATRILRRREKEGAQRHIIIAMTANAAQSAKQFCLDAGMDGYIVKPVKPESLVPYLRPLLAHGASAACPADGAELPSSALDREEAEENRPRIWNRQLALEYVGGDKELLMELMQLFLTKSNTLLASVEAACAENDGDALGRAAHAFKGAVNHFAAEKCQQLAGTIESKAVKRTLKGMEADVEKLRQATKELVAELSAAVALHLSEKAG